MGVAVLGREMFTEADAARLLGVPQRTLNYWLEGGERRGRLYKPVIRVEPLSERKLAALYQLIRRQGRTCAS